jgi:hypothetical protein
MAREIALGGLGGEHVAVVDDADFDLVAQYHWTAVRRRRAIYARRDRPRGGGPARGQYMHNLITGCIGVDHVDHDGLNNQRANLRPATVRQNAANRGARAGATSRFKGVHLGRRGRWVAQIGVDGHSTQIGSYYAELDAARAYDRAAEARYGRWAWLNRDHLREDMMRTDSWAPCLLDPRHDTDTRVCAGCRRNLALRVNDLPDLYARLADALERGTGGDGTGRSATKVHSQPPCRVDVLSLRGPAADGYEDPYGDQTGTTFVGPLLDWSAEWAERLGADIDPPAGVTPAVNWAASFLARHLDWACNEHPHLADFAQDVHTVESAARDALGEKPARAPSLGRCPASLPTGVRCGTRLKADPITKEAVVCPSCDARWEWIDLTVLGRQLRGAA